MVNPKNNSFDLFKIFLEKIDDLKGKWHARKTQGYTS